MHLTDAIMVQSIIRIGRATVVKVFNYNNRDDVRKFAAAADQAIREGGSSTLERLMVSEAAWESATDAILAAEHDATRRLWRKEVTDA